MNFRRCPLVAALRAPESTCAASGREWDVLVRQARQADMLGYLYQRLESDGLLERVPAAPRRHLYSGHVVARKQARDVRWEVRCVSRTLRRIGVPMILLKGAAYVMSGMPMAASRIFNDVDVLVPKASIDEVEKALLADRWAPMMDNEYDEQYFRRWMHQIPPLVHLQRESVLDVHHTIVPETSRIEVHRELLFERARPLADHEGVSVLAPTHMVLHSASHLFDNGEFEHGLRDLADMDILLRHFGAEPSFWEQLLGDAASLGLTTDLKLALRCTHQILDTPVPPAAMRTSAGWAPRGMRAALLNLLFDHSLAPDHPDAPARFADFCRWLLYVRSHYLRMPMPMLIPHLGRKALRRFGVE